MPNGALVLAIRSDRWHRKICWVDRYSSGQGIILAPRKSFLESVEIKVLEYLSLLS
jgi:hypothetical protein